MSLLALTGRAGRSASAFSSTLSSSSSSLSAALPCSSAVGCSRIRMPLRAKMRDRRVGAIAHMATESEDGTSRATESDDRGKVKESIKELPGDEAEDVLFNNLYGLRTIVLNRPAKLNALNGSMIRKIIPRLVEWERSDMANVVVMKGAGDKAFCAGGDVLALVKQNQEEGGPAKSADYFALEYKLDHYIATYKKPYIAFMNGITMGGGVGLSIHAPFRIATERTVFAMPETDIGLFPDVGASFFMPRLPGSVGTYLALTGEKLTGVNVFYTGIATHYLHSTTLPDVESRLAELRFKDYDDLTSRLKIIQRTLEEFATGLPPQTQEPLLLGGDFRKAIDRCFGQDRIVDVVNALSTVVEEGGLLGQWAEYTLSVLHQRSPTSLHVTLKQMRISREWWIAETFRREHVMAAQFMKGHDFNEGVLKKLSREHKGTPQWEPACLRDIAPNSRIADKYLPPWCEVEGVKALELLTDRDFAEYPHAWTGIPTETEVARVVAQGKFTTRRQVVDLLVRERDGRQGIGIVVGEILARSTRWKEDGTLEWACPETIGM